jgi:hypothetical protein
MEHQYIVVPSEDGQLVGQQESDQGSFCKADPGFHSHCQGIVAFQNYPLGAIFTIFLPILAFDDGERFYNVAHVVAFHDVKV